MIDQIESWENAAERRYDEMAQPDGKLKCDCGSNFDPNIEGGTLSPNPYAMPVCDKCFNEAIKALKEKETK